MGFDGDKLVYDYLSQVGDLAQTTPLTSAERARLVAQLRQDIDTRRAAAGPRGEAPKEVRKLLDRLGTPDEVVQRAVRGGVPGGGGGSSSGLGTGSGTGAGWATGAGYPGSPQTSRPGPETPSGSAGTFGAPPTEDPGPRRRGFFGRSRGSAAATNTGGSTALGPSAAFGGPDLLGSALGTNGGSGQPGPEPGTGAFGRTRGPGGSGRRGAGGGSGTGASVGPGAVGAAGPGTAGVGEGPGAGSVPAGPGVSGHGGAFGAAGPAAGAGSPGAPRGPETPGTPRAGHGPGGPGTGSGPQVPASGPGPSAGAGPSTGSAPSPGAASGYPGSPTSPGSYGDSGSVYESSGGRPSIPAQAGPASGGTVGEWWRLPYDGAPAAAFPEAGEAGPPPLLGADLDFGSWDNVHFDFGFDEQAQAPEAKPRPAPPPPVPAPPVPPPTLLQRLLGGVPTQPQQAPAPAGQPEPAPAPAPRRGLFGRRRGVAPVRRASGPLLLVEALASLVLLAGAVLGLWYLSLLGWFAAYFSLRLGQSARKFTALGIPALTLAGGVLWLWLRATGRWGGPALTGAAYHQAVHDLVPILLRTASALSSAFLGWLVYRQRRS
jgi:hypothetical protein